MEDLIVIGSTGFTGKRLCGALQERGLAFDVLVREASDTSVVSRFCSRLVRCDLTNEDALFSILSKYRRCIHIPDLSAIKNTKSYISVFERAGLEKVVFVSSTNMFTKLPAPTKPFREAAEVAIKSSDLNYVIIRPTMIYGGPDDINVSRLMKLIKRWPLFPLFNAGKALQQPIFVEDLAQALADLIMSEQTDRKIYNVSGPMPMPFREMVEKIGNSIGKSPKLVTLPVRPVYAIARLLEILKVPIPFRSEQFLRLLEDKNFDHDAAFADFDFKPRSFEEGLRVGFNVKDQ